ncbi:hypothetical protein BDV41DRAFT_545819 [Aspergillus transmontanensis]|uniref:Uncharacterized protein n=1 Tax=Aspergillus transmontanensis TaxID=1034304 RepID=A0A5N6VNS4_9EURO|nr:hypothetical protein BDV41DRAFT_545819 [Aspergillus transmontanensis]
MLIGLLELLEELPNAIRARCRFVVFWPNTFSFYLSFPCSISFSFSLSFLCSISFSLKTFVAFEHVGIPQGTYLRGLRGDKKK